jgi:hypothetical protein
MDIAAPIAQVDYSAPAGATFHKASDFLTAGLGDDGNQLIYEDGVWRLNLEDG